MADPGQDPRGGPDLDSLWLMLDLTPGGRRRDWYPKLEYGHNAPTTQPVGQGSMSEGLTPLGRKKVPHDERQR